jgi:very-short-patch-repair endonuclease
LRNRRLEGLKFRRQTPIGRYVVDFMCFRHRLIIEADGYWHDAEADVRRDAELAAQGYRVLRFDNRDIIGNQDLVFAAILEAVRPKDDSAPERPLVESSRTLLGPGRRFTDRRV